MPQILIFIYFLCCNLTVGQDGSRSPASLYMLFSPIPPIVIVKKEQKTLPEEELDRLTDLIQGNTNFPGDFSCSGWSTMLKSDCLWVAIELGGRGKKGDFLVNQWGGCALPPLPPPKKNNLFPSQECITMWYWSCFVLCPMACSNIYIICACQQL